MLYTLKQIKGGIMGIMEIGFAGGPELLATAIDKNKDGKTTKAEIQEYLEQNTVLDNKIKIVLEDIKSRLKNYMGNNDFKKRVEDLLVKQEAEIIDVQKTTEKSNTKTITKTKIEVTKSQFKGELPQGEQIVDNKLKNTYVNTQVDKTKTSIDNLSKNLDLRTELNKILENESYRDAEGYSIKKMLQSVFSSESGKYESILIQKDGVEAKFNENQDKLDRAVLSLTGHTQTEGISIISGTTNTVMKALPWLAGIYVTDIPLPFITKLVPGADLNKASAFKEWINGDMKQEFAVFYKEHKVDHDTDVLGHQLVLKELMAKLPKAESAKLAKGDFSSLDKKTKELVVKYNKEVIIPNLEIVTDSSFGLWDKLFDKKETRAKVILEGLRKNPNDLNIIAELIALLQEEGDMDAQIINKVSKQVEGSNKLEKNRQDINKQKLLKENGLDEIAALYLYSDLDQVKQLGLSSSDVKSLDSLFELLSNETLNIEAIKKWKTNNPSTAKFIEGLYQNKDLRKKYLIGEAKKLQGKKLTKIKVAGSAHGRDLSSLNNTEALKAATTETPDGKNSTLVLAYKSFLDKNKGDLVGISYEDFKDAFAKKTNVGIDYITKDEVLNTSRRDGRSTLTEFATLARVKGDKEVYKLKPVEKTYTYYEQGKEITATVTYNLYMRPACDNPIIVPSSIKVDKVEKAPELDTTTLNTRNAMMPIVIPWTMVDNFIGGKGGNGGGNTPDANSLPGSGDVVNPVETGLDM